MSDYREILARKILGKQDKLESNKLTIIDNEKRIEMCEETIIRFKIENDILMEEIAFLKKRRKENE
tara:strand:+ start:1756 stop:1953 length:198 start_codon:yes stop_codon:yes gene_type:complete